jgi:hypothetical protein
MAIVASATFLGLITAILVTAAAAVGSIAALALGNRRHWNRRRKWKIAGFIALCLALTAAAAGLAAVSHGPSNQIAIKERGSEPPPLLAKAAYSLTPSSDPLSNDSDKIDLDTGCPGWGPTRIHVGRHRCGELADLILEAHELHTPEYRPLMLKLPNATEASYVSCREAFMDDSSDSISRIPVNEIKAGINICVRTDKHSIAAVHMKRVESRPHSNIIISYRIWSP